MTTFLRQALLTLAALALVACPWFFSNADDWNAGPVILAGAGLMLALALLAPFLASSARFGATSAAFGAFLLWAVVSTPHSVALFHSQRGLAVWLAGGAVYFAIVLAHPRGSWLRLATIVLVSGIAALGVVSLLHNTPGARMTGTFSNADCYAALLLMAMLLGIGSLPDRRPVFTVILGVDVLALGTALLATGCRAALMGLVVAGGMVLYRHLHKLGPRWRTVGGPLIGIVLVLMVLGWVAFGPYLMSRVAEATASDGAEAWSIRKLVVQGAPHAVARYAVWGSGIGTFAMAFTQDRPYGLFHGYINQAHFDLIQVAVELGVPGLLLLVIAIVTAVRPKRHAGPAAGLIGVLVYSLTNFALPVPTDLIWFCALLGLAEAWQQAHHGRSHARPAETKETAVEEPLADKASDSEGRRRKHRKKRRHTQAWDWLKHFKMRPRPAPDPDRGLSWRRIGGAVSLVLLMSASAWSYQVGQTALHSLGVDAAVDQHVQDYEWADALQMAEAAEQREPGNEAAHLRMAHLLERVGQLDGSRLMVKYADEEYDWALALNPRAAGLLLDVAGAAERGHDKARARQLLDQATKLYPEDPRPWIELARLALEDQWLDTATADLWQAMRNDRDRIGALGGALAVLQLQQGTAAQQLQQWNATATPDQREALIAAALSAAKALEPAARPDAEEALLKEALALQPGNADAMAALAELAMPHSAADCLHWLDQASQHGGPPVATAVAALLDNPPDDRLTVAIQLARAWLGAHASDEHVTLCLAHLLVRHKEVPAALTVYEQIVHQDNSQPGLLVEYAQLCIQSGDKTRALGLYRDALRLDPSNADYQQAITTLDSEK